MTSDSQHQNYLSFGNTLEEFAAVFDVATSRGAHDNGNASAVNSRTETKMSTMLLDRLDEEFMSGIQDIEPSRKFCALAPGWLRCYC